jgi:hypothetical protein
MLEKNYLNGTKKFLKKLSYNNFTFSRFVASLMMIAKVYCNITFDFYLGRHEEKKNIVCDPGQIEFSSQTNIFFIRVGLP